MIAATQRQSAHENGKIDGPQNKRLAVADRETIVRPSDSASKHQAHLQSRISRTDRLLGKWRG